MLDKLHIYICVFACFVVAAAGLAAGVPSGDLCLWLIIAIVAFYIFGLIIEYYLKRNVFPAKKLDIDENSSDGHNEKEE
ncbi:MAG: hypothetical protein LBU32_18435 [Clostridiales bacterium]|jgi:bacteriorhodopsin|nr:hypothetical protein [Clostridiales bacterium]